MSSVDSNFSIPPYLFSSNPPIRNGQSSPIQNPIPSQFVQQTLRPDEYKDLDEHKEDNLSFIKKKGDLLTTLFTQQNFEEFAKERQLLDFLMDTTLYKKANMLVQAGSIDRAIEAIAAISLKHKDIYLDSMIPNLLQTEKFDEASRFCELLSNDSKNKYLKKISIGFIKKGSYEQGFEIAKKISDVPLQCYFLEDIVPFLLQNKQFNEAIEITESFSDPVKNPYLRKISCHLKDLGSIDEAIQVINKISDSSIKDSSLEHILGFSIENKNFNKAFEIAQKISNIEARFFNFSEIKKKSGDSSLNKKIEDLMEPGFESSFEEKDAVDEKE